MDKISWRVSACFVVMVVGTRASSFMDVQKRSHGDVTYVQELSTNIIDMQLQYSVRVSFGTPPQEFDLVLDTGSADLWVQGTDCDDCSSFTRKRYNVSQSKTFHQKCKDKLRSACEFEIQYGSGKSYGIVGEEHVSIGEFEVPNWVPMGVTYNETGSIARVLGSSGIIGFGLPGLAKYSTPSITSFIKSFSLYTKEDGGILTINGLLGKYEPFQEDRWATLPVEKYGNALTYWTVGVPELKFGNTFLCGQGQARCQAVFDSGTGLIAVPQKVWSQLAHILRLSKCSNLVSDGGLFRCSIGRVPELNLFLGSSSGYRIKLPQEAYTLKSENDATSVLIGIVESPLNVNVWILGNIFLKEFYTQYDIQNNQIRFTRDDMQFTKSEVPYEEQQTYFDKYYDHAQANYLFFATISLTCCFILYFCLSDLKFRFRSRDKGEAFNDGVVVQIEDQRAAGETSTVYQEYKGDLPKSAAIHYM